MKKWMVVTGLMVFVVAVLAGVSVVFAWDDSSEEAVLADELDVLGHMVEMACANQDCSGFLPEFRIPELKPEVTLEPDGDVPVPFVDDDSVFGGSCLDGNNGWSTRSYDYWGDCIYGYTPDLGAFINCTMSKGAPYHAAVGMYDHPTPRIVMCYFDDYNEQWYLAGWAELGCAFNLFVNGNPNANSIQIIRWQQGDLNCPTVDFTDRFDYTHAPPPERRLYMFGQGGTDWIFGSQYSDFRLQGERVAGRDGDNRIYLETDGVNHPMAEGGDGDDLIFGTWKNDFIWGGDGDDTIYGYGGTDYLWGEAGNDTLHGGTGRDWLYGGTGNDTLWGHPSYVDTCDGGPGQDTCHYCEISINCQ